MNEPINKALMPYIHLDSWSLLICFYTLKWIFPVLYSYLCHYPIIYTSRDKKLKNYPVTYQTAWKKSRHLGNWIFFLLRNILPLINSPFCVCVWTILWVLTNIYSCVTTITPEFFHRLLLPVPLANHSAYSNQWSFLCPYSFTFSRMFYKCNNTGEAFEPDFFHLAWCI